MAREKKESRLEELAHWWWRPGMGVVVEILVEVVPETLMGVGVPEFLEAVVEIQSSLVVVVALEIPMEGAPGTRRGVGAPGFLEAVVVEFQSSEVVVVGEERPSGCGLVQHTWCRWSWCL